MNLVEKSYILLYPNKDISDYKFSLSYNGRFSSYNGHVKYGYGKYEFAISKEWRGVSDEIQMGLIQHLMQKVFKTKEKSVYLDLYDTFMKNVHVAVPKDRVNSYLKESFDRVNERYFLGTVVMPNLVFGKKSFSKLGSYEYGKDTITMSSVFKGLDVLDLPMLDYVMFHEMLHKVHKFKTVNGRSRHHTSQFKSAERQFEGASHMEGTLSKFLRKKKIKNFIGLD